MTRLLHRIFVIAALLLLVGQSANAQLLFVLDEAVQQGVPGATLTFSGTLTNTGNERLFLNGSSLDVSDGRLTGDSSPFFDNSPLFLEPFGTEGSSWSGNLFHVEISSTMNNSTNDGAFTIFGGADSFAFDNLGSRQFFVQVVPAPSALVTLFIGAVPGIAFMLRRRRT